jgi:drug/metabolite transporter (DMT)-like permease
MTGWFPFAVAALLLMGTQRFLYKVAVERNCDTALTTFSFMATVTAISVAAFFLGGGQVADPCFLLLVGLANSLAFLIATVSHMEALRSLPAGVAYPLIRLDVLVVVLLSFILFQERILDRQVIGLALAVTSALLVLRERPGGAFAARSARGLLFVGAAVLGGTGAALSSRYAALATDKTAFMAVSYGISTLFLICAGLRHAGGASPVNPGSSLVTGIAMGILNVVGFYAYLEGLARGPLSLVTVITGMHFVVAVILSLLIHRERMTVLRACGILLAVASLFLLKG